MKAWLLALVLAFSSVTAKADEKCLEASCMPMTFRMMPNDTVFAQGTFQIDSDKTFAQFAKVYNLTGKTIVFDSRGGAVLAAIDLGKQIRKLNMKTTVGVVFEDGEIRPQGICASMCPFVLLGGINTWIPDGNRVLVHQIYVHSKDNENDMISNILVARIMTDVGRIIDYTIKMGGSAKLVSMALTVAPWKDLKKLTRSEMVATRLIK